MANPKILEQKQLVIDEIKEKVENSNGIVLFDYRGLTDAPSAVAFSKDQIAPIKVLANFMKKHKAVTLKVGLVDGEVTTEEELNSLATIPSREGLLTMLAGGMLAIPKDLAICLDLYAKKLEEENN